MFFVILFAILVGSIDLIIAFAISLLKSISVVTGIPADIPVGISVLGIFTDF